MTTTHDQEDPRPLTSDQLSILRLVGKGFSAPVVAWFMGTDTPTIRSELAAIKRGIKKRAFIDCDELRKFEALS